MRAKLNGLVAAGLFTCALSGHAAGLVTPDNDLRNDLAWLSDRGVINVSLSTATEPGRDQFRYRAGQAGHQYREKRHRPRAAPCRCLESQHPRQRLRVDG